MLRVLKKKKSNITYNIHLAHIIFYNYIFIYIILCCFTSLVCTYNVHISINKWLFNIVFIKHKRFKIYIGILYTFPVEFACHRCSNVTCKLQYFFKEKIINIHQSAYITSLIIKRYLFTCINNKQWGFLFITKYDKKKTILNLNKKYSLFHWIRKTNRILYHIWITNIIL